MNRKLIAACAVVAAAFSAPALAQAPYPSKTIRLIVGYAAGGASDIMARSVARKLAEQTGQPVVVENRAGAASNIGAEAVAKSPADGYTLLLGTIAFSVNPSLYAKLNYDPLKDFDAVGGVASTPFLLVAHPVAQVSTVAELIRSAKAAKDPLVFATAGSGSGAHLFMEYFLNATGVKMTHVPYQGTAPAMNDVMAGRVPITFDNIITTLPQVKAGKLKGLAVSTKARTPVAPEIPTMQEAGVAGFDATAWFGVFAPTGTPAAIVQKLNAEINLALRDPQVRDTFLASGSDPMPMTPAEFGAFYRAEVEKWRKVVRAANLKVD